MTKALLDVDLRRGTTRVGCGRAQHKEPVGLLLKVVGYWQRVVGLVSQSVTVAEPKRRGHERHTHG